VKKWILPSIIDHKWLPFWIRKLKVKKDEEDVVVEKEEGNVDVEEGAGDIVVEKDGNNTANEVDKIIQERATMIDIVNDVVSED